MTTDDKYSLRNTGNLMQNIRMHLCQKQIGLSQFYCVILKSASNLEDFKKKMTLLADLFPKLIKTWLDKCLESPVWEDPSTDNMVNWSKHLFHLNGTPFNIIIDHCEGNWVGRSHFLWHAKSWGCLLTLWLPMTSILFLVEKIWRKQFRCSYLKNKSLFVNFFVHFSNLHQILEIFKHRKPS